MDNVQKKDAFFMASLIGGLASERVCLQLLNHACLSVHNRIFLRIMPISEIFCLKWNDFKDNLKNTYETLRKDMDFSDVTLACEDGYQIEAHKVILSSSSPFFQKVLKMNQHVHPLIYMRGIKPIDLIAIVDFLYYGEINVYQENVDNFLKIADELELKGLNRETSGEEGEEKGFSESYQEQEDQPSLLNDVAQKVYNTISTITASQEYVDDFKAENKEQLCYKSTVDISKHGDLDKQIEAVMGRSEKIIKIGGRKNGEVRMGKAYICQICFKEGKRSNIMVHIEASHLDGILISCNLCEKTFKSRVYLKQHISHQHTNQKSPIIA